MALLLGEAAKQLLQLVPTTLEATQIPAVRPATQNRVPALDFFPERVQFIDEPLRLAEVALEDGPSRPMKWESEGERWLAEPLGDGGVCVDLCLDGTGVEGFVQGMKRNCRFSWASSRSPAFSAS